jgi:hypothetical protein
MRVALITDGIWPYVLGGMQKHSYYLCKYLAKNKVQVDLIHFNQSTYNISQLEFFSEEEKKYITSIVIDFPKSFHFPGHYFYNSYRHSKLIFQALQHQIQAYNFIYAKGFTGWYLINQKHNHNLNCCPIGCGASSSSAFRESSSFNVRYLSPRFKWLRNVSKTAKF